MIQLCNYIIIYPPPIQNFNVTTSKYFICYKITACPFTLKIVGTFYMQGYKVKEKTAIVPHCTPSFKTQWAP